MKEGGMEFHDASDIFSSLFGFERNTKPQKGEDIEHRMKMSLEDLYMGKQKKLKITAKKVCPVCHGKGSTVPNAVKTCDRCGGKGIRTVTRQMGPGFISQSREPCSFCRQRGVIIADKDKCPECHAEYVVDKEKEIDIFVEKGSRAGQRIVLKNEGDEEPGIEAGDLIIIIEEKPHSLFTRKGNDLFMKKKISFGESLCGCTFEIPTLDNRHLLIHTSEGDIIKPDDKRCIKNEGMPVYRSSLDKGNLIIQFEVDYPEKGSIDSKMKKHLLELFPVPEAPAPSGTDVEEVELLDPSEVEDNNSSNYQQQGGYRYSYSRGPQHTSTSATGEDDDDDQRGYGPRTQQVQCSIQ